jgi:hypothetical protein
VLIETDALIKFKRDDSIDMLASISTGAASNGPFGFSSMFMAFGLRARDLSLRGPFCAVAVAIAAEKAIVESFMILDVY